MKDIYMKQPSKETPRRPKGFGELLTRPEAIQMLYLEALLAAESEPKPGPERRNGVNRAEESAPGRSARGALPPLGDPALCVSHHHGHLDGGALGESDAGTKDARDFRREGRDPRGFCGRDAGDERRGRRFSEPGAALSSSGRAERKPLTALESAMSESFFGRWMEMAFSWRWAQVLIC